MGQFEPNAIVPGRRWSGKLPDDLEQLLDSCVVTLNSFLKFGEFRQKLLIGRQRFAHSHKCANHEDTHLDCSSRIQNIGRHYRAMFGESQRQITATAVART